jgi:hypothetical protein
MFDCIHCSFVADTEEKAYGHLKYHPALECYGCRQSWLLSEERVHGRHLPLPKDKLVTVFRCMLCKFQSPNLRSHFNSHVKPFRCTICPYAGSQKVLLTKHMEHHTPNPHAQFHCPHCSFCHPDPKQDESHLALHGEHKSPDRKEQPAKRQKVEVVEELAPEFINSKEEDGFIVLVDCFPRLSLEVKDPLLKPSPTFLSEQQLCLPREFKPAVRFSEELARIYWEKDNKLAATMGNRTLVIGRVQRGEVPNYEVDITLNHATVSRGVHLLVQTGFDTATLKLDWVVKNFGINGTLLNGKPVNRDNRRLRNGAIIQCGTSPHKLRIEINQSGVDHATAVLVERHKANMEAQRRALLNE